MKKKIFALFACLIVIIATFAVPTFAYSYEYGGDDYSTDGDHTDVDYRSGLVMLTSDWSPADTTGMTMIKWDTYPVNVCHGEAYVLSTQSVSIRAPKDENNVASNGMYVKFVDTDNVAYVMKLYSTRFKWYVKDEEQYHYYAEVLFTNDTTEGADELNLLLTYDFHSFTPYTLTNSTTGEIVTTDIESIEFYFYESGIFGVTTYSSGLDNYGLNNWYRSLGTATVHHYYDYDKGNDYGYDRGYDLGWQNGYYDGNAVGYESGYDIGYESGYDVGYEKGHDNGYIEGTDDGYYSGYIKGESDGKESGKTEALNMQSTLKNLIFSIFDAPFFVISSSLNFDLFGINIAGTLIALISTALIVWILKIIIVKLF